MRALYVRGQVKRDKDGTLSIADLGTLRSLGGSSHGQRPRLRPEFILHAPLPKLVVIVLGKAVGFVADELEEP